MELKHIMDQVYNKFMQLHQLLQCYKVVHEPDVCTLEWDTVDWGSSRRHRRVWWANLIKMQKMQFNIDDWEWKTSAVWRAAGTTGPPVNQTCGCIIWFALWIFVHKLGA